MEQKAQPIETQFGASLAGRYSTLSLEELLVCYQNANLEAFDELYKRTNKLLFNFIRKRLPAKQDAEDVFQEAYFRLHKYIPTYKPEQRAIVWIFAIARNAIIDRHKLNRRFQYSSLEDIDIACTKESSESRIAFVEVFEQLLKGLQESEKKLFTDRVLNEIDYEEISTLHGISVVNARQKVSRLMKNAKLRFGRL